MYVLLIKTDYYFILVFFPNFFYKVNFNVVKEVAQTQQYAYIALQFFRYSENTF